MDAVSGSATMECCPRPRQGYSLIEIVIVVGVLGILLGLLLPAVQNARGAAARAGCANNLKQIGLALHHYHDQHGRLPPRPLKAGGRDPDGLVSWRVLILPYLDQGPLWRTVEAACRADPVATHNPPHTGLNVVLKSYICPSDARLSSPQADPLIGWAAYSSYVGVIGSSGADGTLGVRPGIEFTSITDGMSNTAMAGERPPPDTFESGNWYTAYWTLDVAIAAIGLSIPNEPCHGLFYFGPGRTDNRCDQFHLWSLHPGGANFLFADGSVRFLPYSARDVLPALATRAGGEVVTLPD